ncbi:alpha/beta hydrolase family protein [Photorhabdus heterorhabditis]|uniref:alpha/beta hydrolase family protein n=1 Tax=Photorhabdus heterorhabditis TaxID=880156 RepID=UPI001BD3FE40|nr:dienelactone hydrolase [Photorhabdus heterorhabditis]MBS9440672.1 dienelactone hydrolase [Photorhabdus heterorhabditis]
MLRSTIHYFLAALSTFMLIAFIQSVQAAGFSLIDVPADEQGPEMHGAVWYPCQSPAGQFQLGPFTLPGVRDCVASGSMWSLVIISHGSAGSFLGHHDTAEALADAGFVVAAINHPGDNFQDVSDQGHLRVFVNRPNDIKRLIDFMTGTWPEHTHLASGEIGFFGFSRGGYTGLAAAGAKPDYGMAANFCLRDDLPLCKEAREREFLVLPKSDIRIRAFVLADPLNLFSQDGFKSVSAPIQLWASEFGGDGVVLKDIESIRNALRFAPEFHIAKNAGHFSFLAPCTIRQKRDVPIICTDPAGFDRINFHKEFNDEVIQFFKRTLQNKTF